MASPVSIGNYPVGVALTPIGVTANYTAKLADFVVVNATGLTITLPTAPPVGTQVAINGYQVPGNPTIIQCGSGDSLFRSTGTQVTATTLYNYTLIVEYNNDTTWRVVADTAPPKLPAGKLQLTSAMTFIAGAFAAIQFNSLIWSQSGVGVSGGGFQVPNAGIYRVNAQVLLDQSSPTGRYDLGVNNMTQNPSISDGSGAEQATILFHTAGQYEGLVCNAPIRCNAGDVVNAVFKNWTGASALVYGQVGNWTTLSVMQESS